MTTKTKTKSAKTTDIKELTSLCDALVAEIDNLMSQNLAPAQTGKILGDIISSFTKQYSVYK